MKFSSTLQEGVFRKRYKRFFADIEWNGEMITAHVPNTGSMKSCNTPGSKCRFSVNDDPSRKLKYTLEMVQSESGSWVGVNTMLPNKIVREALLGRALPHWKKIDGEVKPEYKISAQTRFDFAIVEEKNDKIYFIEVKNVSLIDGDVAKFPDAVTERGQKHLRELMTLIEEGHQGELVLTIQRDDARSFSPADEIDPEYGRLLRQAIQKGLRVTPVVVSLNESEIALTTRVLPLKI